MRTQAILFILLSFVTGCWAQSGSGSLSTLDDAINRRDYYQKLKQTRLDSLARRIRPGDDKETRLNTYNRLFEEYLAFNFDSTMAYVERAEALLQPGDSYDLKAQVNIHRALSLATSGHFSHAINILKGIDSRRLSKKLKEEYYAACEWTYGVWAEYSDKRSIAPEFKKESLTYLDSLIEVTDASTPEYSYRQAERNLRMQNYEEAEKNYLATLKHIPVQSRLYAQAAYALALTYKELGDKQKYKEWVINAAIADQTVPLKENLALQQLALFLKEEDGDIERANKYLKVALEDAIFYNNRLRMLEVAEKIPDIANVYEDIVKNQNRRLKIYIAIIGLLSLILGAFTIFIYRQRREASRSKDTLFTLNSKLKDLNLQLSITNRSREQYVSLFLDLCAAYIDKLNRFPLVLKLKVKQLSDVNSVADRYVRPTESETREMFQNFDTAFLRLYPDYIRELNMLLKPDKGIVPKKGELMNTDLRIYALVRMGITDSTKIATLLFLSPQTIFNHRTQMRNRALNRDSFENDVTHICEIN